MSRDQSDHGLLCALGVDCDPSCQQHLHAQGLRPDLFKLSCSYRSKPVLWQSSADFGFILSRQGFALVYIYGIVLRTRSCFLLVLY